METTRLSADIPAELMTRLKIYVAVNNSKINAVVIAALTAYLEKGE